MSTFYSSTPWCWVFQKFQGSPKQMIRFGKEMSLFNHENIWWDIHLCFQGCESSENKMGDQKHKRWRSTTRLFLRVQKPFRVNNLSEVTWTWNWLFWPTKNKRSMTRKWHPPVVWSHVFFLDVCFQLIFNLMSVLNVKSILCVLKLL